MFDFKSVVTKRKTALALAFIMTVTAVLPLTRAFTTDASDIVSFYYGFTNTLTTINNYNPMLLTNVSNTGPENKVCIRLPMAGQGLDRNPVGSPMWYRLAYYVPDSGGSAARMNVLLIGKMDQRQAVVIYDVYEYDDGVGDFVQVNDISNTSRNFYYSSYEIWAFNNGAFGWTPAQEVAGRKISLYQEIVDNRNVSPPDLDPLPPGHGIHTTNDLTPEFYIGQGEGFSFKYGGNTELSFLWDGDILYFVTNEMFPGYIINFELDYFSSLFTYQFKSEYRDPIEVDDPFNPGSTILVQPDPMSHTRPPIDRASLSALPGYPGAPGSSWPRTERFINGIDYKSFQSYPIGNVGNLTNWSTPAHTSFMDPPYNLDLGNTPFGSDDLYGLIEDKRYLDKHSETLEHDREPGYDDHRIVMAFNKPKEYIFVPPGPGVTSAGGLFVAASNETYLGLDIRMHQTQGPLLFQVEIDNICDLYVNPEFYTVMGGAGRVIAEDSYLANGDPNPNRIRIIVDGLPGSTIFQPQFYLTDKSHLVDNTKKQVRPNPFALTVPTGQVYTFIEYDIVLRGGVYYLQAVPYKGFNGNYDLFHWPNPIGVFPNPGEYHARLTVSDNGERLLIIPLNLNPEQRDWFAYQLVFSFADRTNIFEPGLQSQILWFRSSPDHVTIETPENFRIIDYRLYADRDVQEDERGTLEFKAGWDISDLESLKRLVWNYLQANPGKEYYEVVYYMFQDTSPDSLPDNGTGNVFDAVSVKFKFEDPTTSKSALMVQHESTAYDTLADPPVSFPASGKVQNTEWHLLPVKTISDVRERQIAYIEVDFLATAGWKDFRNPDGTSRHPAGSDFDFWYPNIYFLNVKPMVINGEKMTGSKNIAASNFDTMTLNDLTKLKVPPPQNLRAHTPRTVGSTEISFIVEYDYPGQGIAEYIRSIYPYDDITVTMDLYICEDEKKLRDVVLTADNPVVTTPPYYDSRMVNSVEALYGRQYDGNPIIFSAIRGIDPIGITKQLPGDSYANPLEALRDGRVVAIKDIVVSGSALTINPFKFDGMDKNQKYYLVADLVVTHRDFPGEEPPKVWRASIPSNIAAVTTEGDIDRPDPSERIPPAPDLQLDAESVGMDTATIFWKPVQPFDEENDTIVYEIIRLRNQQMDNDLRGPSKFTFDYFYDILAGAEPVGLKTTPDGFLQEYAGGNFIDLDREDERYIYSPGNPIRLKDNTLSPNRLYFYYARTVLTTADGVVTYSAWGAVSVTTHPVDPPIKLVIERGRTDYDPLSEVWISFHAPIANIDDLDDKYRFEYQLRPDGGEWGLPIPMTDIQMLKDMAERSDYSDDYIKFYYKITGLTHNTLYTIRVRMVDLVNKDSSVYTNEEQFKTDVDQSDFDEDHTTDQWLDYLRRLLEQLLKDPYWVTRDTDSIFEAVYRPDMFDALISETIDGAITLANGMDGVMSDADEFVYYLPSSAVVAANNANKGFKVAGSDMDVVFSPGAVDTDYNEAVLSAIDDIKAKRASDYFIRIQVLWSAPPPDVDGDLPLSRQAEIIVEAVATTASIKTWDNMVYEKLAALVAEKITDPSLRQAVVDFVRDKKDNETIIALINDIIKNSTGDLHWAALTSLSEILGNRDRQVMVSAYPLTTFDAPVAVVAKSVDKAHSVAAYQFVNGTWAWINHNVVPYGQFYAVFVRAPGIYIFAGRRIEIPGLEDYQGSSDIMALVVKYRLDDYLGKDVINIYGSATRHMVAGSVARLSGSAVGADPFRYLQISSRNRDLAMEMQETVFLIMRLYETKTNVKIETIRIRNYNAMNNVIGLDDKYKASVRAAIEVSLIDSKDFNARALVTVRELLQFLLKIENMRKVSQNRAPEVYW